MSTERKMLFQMVIYVMRLGGELWPTIIAKLRRSGLNDDQIFTELGVPNQKTGDVHAG